MSSLFTLEIQKQSTRQCRPGPRHPWNECADLSQPNDQRIPKTHLFYATAMQVSSEMPIRIAIAMDEIPIIINPRKGELHAFSVEDKATPAIPIGMVATTFPTASRKDGS